MTAPQRVDAEPGKTVDGCNEVGVAAGRQVGSAERTVREEGVSGNQSAVLFAVEADASPRMTGRVDDHELTDPVAVRERFGGNSGRVFAEMTGEGEGIVGKEGEVAFPDADGCFAKVYEGTEVCHVIKVTVGENDYLDLIFVGGNRGYRLGGIDENVPADVGVCTPADLFQPADRFTHTV